MGDYLCGGVDGNRDGVLRADYFPWVGGTSLVPGNFPDIRSPGTDAGLDARRGIAGVALQLDCPLAGIRGCATREFGDGKLQEQEGPAEAEKMLKNLGFDQDVIDRVSYLVGHHHTYTDIDGMDYQILVEADFLVNYFEDHLETESIKKSVKKIFNTETGIRIATEMFFPEEFQISDTWA